MKIAQDWLTTSLANVLVFIGNGTTAEQNKDGKGLPVTRIETISDEQVDLNRVGYIESPSAKLVERYRIEPGDVLFSHINSEPQIGRAVVYRGRPPVLLHGMNLLRLRFDIDAVDPEFVVLLFRYYRKNGVFISLASRAVGQSSINQGRLKSLQIQLPSLSAQKAIANVLRAVQRAQQVRQRQLTLEHERKAALREQLFTRGVRGTTPTKRVGEFEVPEHWSVTPLGASCEFLQYGTSERCDAGEDASLVLGIPNVVTGKVNLRKVKYLKTDANTKEKLTLVNGDLVFVRTNATKNNTGKCAVFRDEAAGVLFASYLIRARVITGSLHSDFVREFTETWLGKAQLAGRASNAADGKFNINTQTIRRVLIPHPSWDEQAQIAAILKACDAKAAALENEIVLLTELFDLILERLMVGELSVASVIGDNSK